MVLPASCPHSVVVTMGNCRHKINVLDISLGGTHQSFVTTPQRFQTYFYILNVQTCNCILGGDILYACAKFQSEMISLKTFKKRKTMSTEFLTAQ